MYGEVKINCWYNNGSLDTFRALCIQNQNRQISVKLANRSEPVKGTLYSYRLESFEAGGVFLLLTNKAIHPAYYSLDCIESVHIEARKKQSSLEDREFSRDIDCPRSFPSRA
jgi:hypothetical protein